MYAQQRIHDTKDCFYMKLYSELNRMSKVLTFNQTVKSDSFIIKIYHWQYLLNDSLISYC